MPLLFPLAFVFPPCFIRPQLLSFSPYAECWPLYPQEGRTIPLPTVVVVLLLALRISAFPFIPFQYRDKPSSFTHSSQLFTDPRLSPGTPSSDICFIPPPDTTSWSDRCVNGCPYCLPNDKFVPPLAAALDTFSQKLFSNEQLPPPGVSSGPLLLKSSPSVITKHERVLNPDRSPLSSFPSSRDGLPPFL